ncbi:MAG: hypothetical protein ACYS8W_10320 [Planctomycetota bacterium]|jgi:hypothetical protein
MTGLSRPAFFTALFIACLCLVFSGCSSKKDSDSPAVPAGTGTGATGTGTTPTGGTSTSEPTFGSGSYFTSVDELLDHVNTQRLNYGGAGAHLRHDRWKGIPWEGEQHNNTTFPDAFTSDDALADRAQFEAERLAGGGSPQGVQVPYQNGGGGPFWINAINTADWMITAKEEPGSFENSSFPLVPANGSARMGLFYHDFGGDGPAINLVGVGACDAGGGATWWVLQFGP